MEQWKTEKSIRGLLLMLMACTIYVLMQICAKLSYRHSCLTSFHIIYFRGVFLLLCSVIYAGLLNISILSISKGQVVPLVLRIVMGSLCSQLTFYIAAMQPLSVVNAIYYSFPMITAAIAWVVYKEHIHVLDVLAIMISFCGILLIFWPESKGGDFLVNLLCYVGLFISAIMQAIVLLLTRQLVQSMDCCIPPAYHGVGQGLTGGFFLSYAALTKSSNNVTHACSENYLVEMGCVLGIAVTTFVGQLLSSKALEKEKAGRISNINYVMLVYMQFVDVYIFGEPIIIRQTVGVSLICVSGLGICILKYLEIIQ